MNITEYIPTGKENAITRDNLVKVTGFTDREVRRLIADARQEIVIINHQDGKGYYKTSDKAEIERYIKQESKRARTIFYRLKSARKALKEVDSCG